MFLAVTGGFLMKFPHFLILLCMWFAGARALAQHQEVESPQHQSHDHFHHNHLAVFGGGTTKLEGSEETHFTVGADYVRYFPPSGRWGISVFGEAIFAEHREWVFGVPVFFKLNKRLWLRAGPGMEILQAEEENHSGENGEGEESKTKTESEFLFRIGAGYNFEVGALTIAPSLDFDTVRKEVSLVWGINIGKGF
jgi:hypothetical protein